MRGKGFDTFCPLGPAIVTTDELADPSDLEISTLVDGVVARHGRTSQMIWSVPRIIATLSRRMTLLPGTVILTGSPAVTCAPSVIQMAEVIIGGLGTLNNPALNFDR